MVGVDPFAATDSAGATTDFQFKSGTLVPSCEVAGKDIGMTAGVKAQVPKLAVAAERLGFVKLSVCYRARYANGVSMGWYCPVVCSAGYTETLGTITSSTGTWIGAQLEYAWEPRAGGGASTRFAIAPLSATQGWMWMDEIPERAHYWGFDAQCAKGFTSMNVYDAVVRALVTTRCLSVDALLAAKEASNLFAAPTPLKSVHWIGSDAAAIASTERPLRDMVDGPAEALPLNANPAQMTLSSLRQRVFDDLLRALDDASSPVQQAARRVEGARELIRAHVRLGFSQALASDDGLRSVIEGADLPLGSRDELRIRLQAARANPPASDRSAPVPSVFGPFLDGVVAGRGTFADALKPHIGGADGLSPAGTVVGPTLDRLALTRAVLSQPASLGPAPVVSVPVAGATYQRAEVVRASWGCPLEMACSAPVASGESIDTATAGTKTFKVTATDRDGYAFSRTVEYTVAAAPPAGGDTGGGSRGAGGGDPGGSAGPGGSVGDSGDVGPAQPVQKRFALSRVKLLEKAFARRKGTKLAFTLDRAARVKVVLRRLAGRKKLAAGSRSLRGRAGKNRLAFGKGLEAGRYVATVVAGSGATASKPLALKFTVRR